MDAETETKARESGCAAGLVGAIAGAVVGWWAKGDPIGGAMVGGLTTAVVGFVYGVWDAGYFRRGRD